MQYDAPTTAADLSAALAANPAISDETLAAVTAILGLESPTNTTNVGFWDGAGEIIAPEGESPDLLTVAVQAGQGETVNLSIPAEILNNTQAYILASDANLVATFNTIERVIVSGNGDDFLTVNGDRNTTLDGGEGADTLTTSGGNDSVMGGNGDDSISTGAGDDTIHAGEGNDTIDGGDGFDIVKAGTSRADVTLTVNEDGLLVALGDDGQAQMSNVEFIELLGDTIAVAENEADAITLQLYQGVLGRSSEAAGAHYWLDFEAQSGDEIANHFLHSEEFTQKFGDFRDLSDAAFVDQLFANALGRDATEADQIYWVDMLASGEERAVVAVNIVASAEASDNIDSVFLLTGQV